MLREKEIKKSFENVKKDIDNLNLELQEIKLNLYNLQSQFSEFQSLFNIFLKNYPKSNIQTHNLNFDTSTHNFDTSTDTSTVPLEIQGLKSPNSEISSGNKGVSTDRQTVRQTDNYTENTLNSQDYSFKSQDSVNQKIQKAANILESFGNIQTEIKSKFKSMTPQEILVFSTIYELEDQNPLSVTYDLLAIKLNLSQSSIRDYIQRIIQKGIPIIKQKINNKKVCLGISQDLRKIASLDAILRIREL